MMLEFGQETDDLVVVTDTENKPIFAYDFPYDYMYIAFSTPELVEEVYHVYMGGMPGMNSMQNMRAIFGGMGGGRAPQSSADVATTNFVLTRENIGFTNIVAAN